MKKGIILSSTLFLALSLSSCSSVSKIEKFDIDGTALSNERAHEYIGRFREEYYDNNDNDVIENQWYKISMKLEAVEYDGYLTTKTEASVSGKFYLSRFTYENKIELNINEETTIKGTEEYTDKKIDEVEKINTKLKFIEGVRYQETEIEHEEKDYEIKDTSYDMSYSTFEEVASIISLNVDISFYINQVFSYLNYDKYFTLYKIDNGLAYEFDRNLEGNSLETQVYFETMEDSYQLNELKLYNSQDLDVDDGYLKVKSLLKVNKKLTGKIKRPSDLSKYS